MLCLVRYDGTTFKRTLDSFAPSAPSVIAEFDSSLSGAGVIWYVTSNGAEVAAGVCAVSLAFLGFKDDSSNQNLCEFIGAIIAVIGHVVLGNRGRTLALRGDSVTALTWAITGEHRDQRRDDMDSAMCSSRRGHQRDNPHPRGAER
jgi:hypothetical protein